MNYPTAKTIQKRLYWLDKIGPADVLARQVRAIIDGTRPVDRNLREARLCNPFNETEAKLHALDNLLETFGVEYIKSRHDTYHTSRGVDYLNTGDTYTPTVYYDHDSERWLLASWGDLVEKNPRRFAD